MVTTQRTGYADRLATGIKRAAQLSKSVVVTEIEAVAPMDPVTLFDAMQTSFSHERVYWTDPARDLTLFGAGSAYIWEGGTEDRFVTCEAAWGDLVRGAVAVRPEGVRGVGPILLGGFSFDPMREPDAQWRRFPSARFVLPSFLLTITDGTTWLTTNAVVKPGDVLEDVLAEWEERQRLFGALLSVHREPTSGRLALQEHAMREPHVSAWMQSVERLAKEIREQRFDKVVLAREMEITIDEPFDIGQVVRRLWEEQSATYLFAMENQGDCFLTASPEQLVEKHGTKVQSMCLAGSTARGSTSAEDEVLGTALQRDEKNSIEHAWVVRVISSALNELCDDVHAGQESTLYKLRDIQHLYTPIVAKVDEQVSILRLVQCLHPTPALAGHPREVSMSKIREYEPFDRGWYGGPVGWVDDRGDGEFAVAIRSGLICGSKATLIAGCGIVGNSIPSEELRETYLKFRPMLSALGLEG